MGKLFKLKENGTTVRTEIVAGLTTFMTMAYILAVNPNILSATGMDSGAVFTATALAAFLGTLLMAIFANYPFALAPGMGLNAYFAYTVVIGMGYSWQYALTAVFAEGIVFIILSLTNIREAIFNAIPMNLKSAVSVGIGLFIAFVGLQNANIVIGGSTLLQLFSVEGYNAAKGVEASFNNVGITVILALIGIIVTGILVVKKGKELSISNPGTIRVTKEEFYAGGNSDPRNPNILKMFGFVNVGERAGSGIDKIMTAWAEQNWKKPEFDFSERSDRVTLKLEVGQVVYIPGAADIRLSLIHI